MRHGKIDFITSTTWGGHQDGGVLIGKLYDRLEDEQARRQAGKLVLKPATAEST
jgi:hypothetical protein